MSRCLSVSLIRTFLRELETYTDVPELVGRCFLERMGDLQIYEKYCQNKPRSESLWRQCSDCAFFQVTFHLSFRALSVSWRGSSRSVYCKLVKK